MPATRECFAREISSCDTATQRHLNQLANNTSFLCQPGGNQTLTQMTFLLTEMAQGRVAMPEPCYDVPVWTCHADATAASHQGDEAMLQAASVDEIISLAQTENADTCSGWRESAVWAIFRPFMPSYLGSTFPFTQNEVEEKFQCSPPAESVLSQRSIHISRIMLLFALILVFGLHSAQVQGNPFRRQMDGDDWCASGQRVLGRFMHCGMRVIGKMFHSGQEFVLDNGILNTYCSQVMPEIRECFAREISSCDTATQRHLNQLANNTGFLCQPGGNQPLPQITFLVSEAGLGELSLSEACRDETIANCFEDAEDALQVDEDTIETASVDEIVSLAQ
ncbi:hypothetical protein BaRGS_00023045, partial [Batillaria attramentaria]